MTQPDVEETLDLLTGLGASIVVIAILLYSFAVWHLLQEETFCERAYNTLESHKGDLALLRSYQEKCR